ncbi:hypothetical protein LZ30DRAFT_805070 [Colletotrichum cereale]|nr:hypothetical protein LZ30DRAFT_805070 [Colletotrichum cereale]
MSRHAIRLDRWFVSIHTGVGTRVRPVTTTKNQGRLWGCAGGHTAFCVRLSSFVPSLPCIAALLRPAVMDINCGRMPVIIRVENQRSWATMPNLPPSSTLLEPCMAAMTRHMVPKSAHAQRDGKMDGWVGNVGRPAYESASAFQCILDWLLDQSRGQALSHEGPRAPASLRKVAGHDPRWGRECAHLTPLANVDDPPGGRVLPLFTPDFALRIVSGLGPSTPCKQACSGIGDSPGAISVSPFDRLPIGPCCSLSLVRCADVSKLSPWTLRHTPRNDSGIGNALPGVTGSVVVSAATFQPRSLNT